MTDVSGNEFWTGKQNVILRISAFAKSWPKDIVMCQNKNKNKPENSHQVKCWIHLLFNQLTFLLTRDHGIFNGLYDSWFSKWRTDSQCFRSSSSAGAGARYLRAHYSLHPESTSHFYLQGPFQLSSNSTHHGRITSKVGLSNCLCS